MKKSILLAVLCVPLFLSGCNTMDPKTKDFLSNAAPYIESGVYLAASVAIDYGVSDSDKVVKAKCLYGLSSGIRSLMGGAIPTAENLKATLESFAISDGKIWISLATSLSNIYAKEVAKIDGDPKLVMHLLEVIASGVERAAEPYAKQM